MLIKSESNIEKLIKISTRIDDDRLCDLDLSTLDRAGVLADDFRRLYHRANGLYAFESALHIFHIRPTQNLIEHEYNYDLSVDLIEWNQYDLWIYKYNLENSEMLFFAEDIFGGQFCAFEGKIWTFDPEVGKIGFMASNLEDWCEVLLSDYSFCTGYKLAHEWQIVNGSVKPGYRLIPKVPFVLGGEFAAENLFSCDALEGMMIRAELHDKIQDLSDGQDMYLKIVD